MLPAPDIVDREKATDQCVRHEGLIEAGRHTRDSVLLWSDANQQKANLGRKSAPASGGTACSHLSHTTSDALEHMVVSVDESRNDHAVGQRDSQVRGLEFVRQLARPPDPLDHVTLHVNSGILKLAQLIIEGGQDWNVLRNAISISALPEERP